MDQSGDLISTTDDQEYEVTKEAAQCIDFVGLKQEIRGVIVEVFINNRRLPPRGERTGTCGSLQERNTFEVVPKKMAGSQRPIPVK